MCVGLDRAELAESLEPWRAITKIAAPTITAQAKIGQRSEADRGGRRGACLGGRGCPVLRLVLPRRRTGGRLAMAVGVASGLY